MTSNCDAVLQTPELLQEILLHLDMRTLLTSAQLVNRQWHELITTSPVLQQALYFEPIASSSDPATQNPLLSELFPYWFREESRCEGSETPGPALIGREEFSGLPMARKSRRHAFMYPRASWRRMLVRQPPVLKLGRWTTAHGQWGDSHEMEIDEVPEGLRMGRFYDLAQNWVGKVVSHFVVFWGSSGVAAYTTTLYGSMLEPIEKGQLEALSRRVDLAVLRHMVVQCSGEYPDEQFEEAFTFPVSEGQGDD
ncbi:hypothetical protein F5Y08DRAFT_10842 [Xylaria arbuscula]|nr:hypothetical protein F5Y08DRAFT_10842 [Xylaria arbuscula]